MKQRSNKMNRFRVASRLVMAGGTLLGGGYVLSGAMPGDPLGVSALVGRAIANHRHNLLPETIIMVRHGESEGNADTTLYRTKPDNLIELTDQGIEQALAAGERIRKIIGPDARVHLYVSPFVRTRQTAAYLRKAINSNIVMTDLDSRIREQEFGNLQGDEHLQQREDQEFVGRYFYRFPTGESGADVFDRATNWWDNTIPVINMQRGIKSVDTVIVVSHGLTMRFILMHLNHWSVSTFHSVWNANNCDIYVLKKDSAVLGPKPYVLSDLGDKPESSKILEVTMQDGSKKVVELWDYLAIPSPRTRQLPIVHKMLQEQHGLNPADIVSIDFHPREGGIGTRACKFLEEESEQVGFH